MTTTPLRYPLSTNICTKCRERYAIFNDTLCGACVESEERSDRSRCEYCGDLDKAYKIGNGGKMVRVQILGNGYCRKCWDIRRAKVGER